jgi:squalene monooxygenase
MTPNHNSEIINPKYEICIVGAGVAGATLAAYLGKHGKKICLVERDWKERDTIVGELLQPGGVLQLQQMQLDFLLNDIDAQNVNGYALFLNGEHFNIAYPDNIAVSGKGFRNGKLLQNIRSYVQSLPSVTCIEGEVKHLIEDAGKISGVSYFSKTDKTEHTISAALTVVCDGPFSLFRQQLSDNKHEVSGFFLGIILKNTSLPYPNHGHVIVAQPSPFLCYPVTKTETRVLIDFPGNTPPKKGNELSAFLKNTIGSQMPVAMLPAFLEAVDEGKFKVMPNHKMPAQPIRKNGAVLLGDSLNMRHPLTGGGMSVAFTDVKLLGDALLRVDDFFSETKTAEAVEHFYNTRHTQDATINILADALYGVMRNQDLKQACYDYLKKGGAYAQEPVSILGAISRDVQLLIRHFFAVAMFGIGNVLKPFPSKEKIQRAYTMLRDAVQIIEPLVLSEKPGVFTKAAIRISGKIFSN